MKIIFIYMNNKGNISLELLLTFMIFIIITSSLLSMAMSEFDSLEETHTRRQAKELTSQVSHTINTVYLMGDSYSQECHLPKQINNDSYILEINSSCVYINSHYQITKDDIIPKNVYIDGKKRKNIILTPDHTYTFTNKNAELYIYS